MGLVSPLSQNPSPNVIVLPAHFKTFCTSSPLMQALNLFPTISSVPLEVLLDRKQKPPFPKSLNMHSLYLLLYLKVGSFLRPLLWTLFVQGDLK